MAERVQAVAKKPEAKRENKVSQTQKTDPSKSISSPVEQILFLQRTIGNQAVGMLIKSGALQAKLRIGQPGDIYEQEADRVAEQVMQMPEPQVSKGTKVSSHAQSNPIQRKCPGCKKGTKIVKEEEEEKLQKKEATGSTPDVVPELESNISAIRGGGRPLPEATRAFFEPRFGADFSGVRVHTGSHAAETAKSINSRAFTVGGNIAFGAGQYSSESHEGRKLLAHELTHTIQQGATNNSPSASTPHYPSADPFRTEQNQRSTSSVAHPKEIMGFDPISSQQRCNKNAVVQRHPHTTTATPPVVAALSPVNALRLLAERLETTALAQFQLALDNTDEAAVQQAGALVLATWFNIEGSRQQIVSAPFTPATPVLTTSPATTSTFTTATSGPNTTASTTAESALPADLQAVYDNARRKVMVGVSTQKFRNLFVLGTERIPSYAGPVAQFILDQTAEVALTVRNTTELIALLQRDNLSETDQWTAIGLLRQHLNPWDFAYMQAVVAQRGAGGRYDRFAEGPRRAYTQLLETQLQIRLQDLAQVSEGMGTLSLIPVENKVRLLQPLSPMEIADMLYGDADKWQTHLLPYNRAALQGVGARTWLLLGTELIVDAEQLVPRFRGLFLSSIRGRQMAQKGGREPYLWAQPAETAIVGNTISYGVSWPGSAFEYVNLQWSAENDPIAVRENHIPERWSGPSGILRWGPESTNAVIEIQAIAPGNHVIKCLLTHKDGRTQELRYLQTVMTLEQKTNLEFRREFTWNRRPDEVLAELRQQRDRLPPSSHERMQLEQRIRELGNTLQEANAESRRYSGHDAHMSPVRAVYVSSEDKPMSVPLMIYVGSDPGYFDAPDYVLKLWDFTLQGNIRDYQGRGRRPQEALRNLFQEFADDAPYPTGNIRFEITPFTMGYTGLYSEIVTYPTDGGTHWAAALRALSMGTMGIGVAAAFLGQGEVAVPAFIFSGLMAGAAGGFSLYDRLSHGDFDWDLQTGMDIMDIAGAMLTLGVSSRVTATARGVGRLSVGGSLQLAVGNAQIAIMAGVHIAQIDAAIGTGNRDEVAYALMRALSDGALILILHRASARLQGSHAPRSALEGEVHGRAQRTGSELILGAESHGIGVAGTGELRGFYFCSNGCANLLNKLNGLLDVMPSNYPGREIYVSMRNRVRTATGRLRTSAITAEQGDELARQFAVELNRHAQFDSALNQLLRMHPDEVATQAAQIRQALARGFERQGAVLGEFGEGMRSARSPTLPTGEPGGASRAGLQQDVMDVFGIRDLQSARRTPGGRAVPEHFEVGNFGHTYAEQLIPDLPPGLNREVTIRLPEGTVRRADRVQFRYNQTGEIIGGTVYEIKPNTGNWPTTGQRQGELYARYLRELYGGEWNAVCRTYDAAAVRRIVRAIRSGG